MNPTAQPPECSYCASSGPVIRSNRRHNVSLDRRGDGGIRRGLRIQRIAEAPRGASDSLVEDSRQFRLMDWSDQVAARTLSRIFAGSCSGLPRAVDPADRRVRGHTTPGEHHERDTRPGLLPAGAGRIDGSREPVWAWAGSPPAAQGLTTDTLPLPGPRSARRATAADTLVLASAASLCKIGQRLRQVADRRPGSSLALA